MSAPVDAPTIRESLLAHRGLARPALLHEERSWSWREYVAEGSRRANHLASLFDPERPAHVGVLADNTPEMAFQLAAAGLGGHVVVGLNNTRRGAALLADIHRADCQALLVEAAYRPLLDGLDLGGLTLLDGEDDQVWGDDTTLPDATPGPDDLFMLVFTSGTGGDPKAVRITHRKITYPGAYLTEKLKITGEDVCYSAMPLFHSNGIMANWSLGVVNGCTMALATRFSARGFLGDVRRMGCTYFNYVGKPLTYLLATPEHVNDADNPLRLAFGNEAGDRDTARFAERFGCQVVDGFGSSENAVVIARDAQTPAHSLGRPLPGIKILAPDGTECPPAEFDAAGLLLNAEACVGEMVNTAGAGQFAGYYNDEAATAERMRGGMYWSGDLAYADAEGFYYFAGRSADWMRVDGENLAVAPIERILVRHPGISQAAVYALPDDVGDMVAAALVLGPVDTPDAAGFERFLLEQPDLSPKAWPRVVRIVDELPTTATNKVIRRALREAGEHAVDRAVWTRDGRGTSYTAG